ncbi:hypothetical protein VMCG_04345 [Cytospora schulzeri]|uniref:Uncharacterized protein n=1 Tax=Cytospora schulzeri TaxID=448051 RepID=A0A423WSK1_9PEZI|nr:hypothetical protein VMCG_04345 [Valsa malicola]
MSLTSHRVIGFEDSCAGQEIEHSPARPYPDGHVTSAPGAQTVHPKSDRAKRTLRRMNYDRRWLQWLSRKNPDAGTHLQCFRDTADFDPSWAYCIESTHSTSRREKPNRGLEAQPISH